MLSNEKNCAKCIKKTQFITEIFDVNAQKSKGTG